MKPRRTSNKALAALRADRPGQKMPPGGEWLPIVSAPRDGTVIELWAEDADPTGAIPMYWDPKFINPIVSDLPGIWVLRGGGLTWSERHYLGGGPTHWRPIISSQDGSDVSK